MSKIIKINKPIILKFEDREIKLPNELKESINRIRKKLNGVMRYE